MFIYNITTNIETAVHEDWLQWMQKTHIPDILATGRFLSAKICRVLVDEELGGVTYSVQYSVKDKETLTAYHENEGISLLKEATQKFGQQAVSFSTELQVLNETHKTPMVSTEYIFTYGTLQHEAVQWEVFGRLLDGTPTQLTNFELSQRKVAGTYPMLIPSPNTNDAIQGIVYSITPDELRKADDYEGDAYKRVSVKLVSGRSAWVYIGKQ